MSENEKTDFFSEKPSLENKLNEDRTKLSEKIREYRMQQDAFRSAEIASGAEQINLAGMYKEGTKEAVKASLNETYQKGELMGKIKSTAVETAEKLGIPAYKLYIQNEIKQAEKKAEKTENIKVQTEKNVQRLEDQLNKTESRVTECANVIKKGIDVYNALQTAITEYWNEINTLKAEQIETGTSNKTQIAYLTKQIDLAKKDGENILKDVNTYKNKFNKIESELNSITPKLSIQRGVYNNLTNSLSVFYQDIGDAKIAVGLLNEGKTLDYIFGLIDKNEVSANSMRGISVTSGPILNEIQRTIDYKNSKVRSRNDNTSWKEELQMLSNNNQMKGQIALDERILKYATLN